MDVSRPSKYFPNKLAAAKINDLEKHSKRDQTCWKHYTFQTENKITFSQKKCAAHFKHDSSLNLPRVLKCFLAIFLRKILCLRIN
jgi:hypothetical protein